MLDPAGFRCTRELLIGLSSTEPGLVLGMKSGRVRGGCQDLAALVVSPSSAFLKVMVATFLTQLARPTIYYYDYGFFFFR